MKTISLDIETYSSIDLSKCGVYRYAQAPDFGILLFGYSVDGGKVNVIDLANGETIPPEIITALTDNSVTKWAFNAAFERVCLSRYLRDRGSFYNEFYSVPDDTVDDYLDPASWRCSMVWAAFMGLPLSLESAGAVLGLEKQKLTEGKDLIKYFCQPCSPTKTNGGRIRNLPEHAPDKREQFKEYNKRDVETEMEIQWKLRKFPVPEFVWDEYILDQQINDRGIQLDMALVKNAIDADGRSRQVLLQQMKEITELDNPNSVAQLKHWLSEQGIETDSLGKKDAAILLKSTPRNISEVLELRLKLAKSSIKKYQAMENCICADGRVRGLFQFYGAARTGRAAGRLIQAQNLPQNHLPDLEQARELIRSGNFTALDMLYESVPEVLSELIRTAFVPKDGYRFIVADFSSIEAVVLAWLAGEKWVLDAYTAKQDLYIRNAEKMFNAPTGSVDKKSPLRQKSKVATLACGYQGSVGALRAFGAVEMGIKEEDLQPLVDAWRSANPNIVRFWWEADKATRTAVKERITIVTHDIKFSYQSGILFITLPSGRRLTYLKPKIGMNRFGNECVTYEGINSAKKWSTIESSPGKWVENITQAVARDILYNAMNTLRHCFIVMHIHDEIVLECDKHMSVENVCEQMSRLPAWAKGLPMRAEGFETNFYLKN